MQATLPDAHPAALHLHDASCLNGMSAQGHAGIVHLTAAICCTSYHSAAAVGGELGTAVVFMHELAPPTAKTKGGCIVFMSVNAGIVFGILVAMIVNAAVPPG